MIIKLINKNAYLSRIKILCIAIEYINKWSNKILINKNCLIKNIGLLS